MRLLTHNTLRNNSAAAKGKGFPLRITAAEVKVDESVALLDEQRIAFLKGIIPTLDWPALVQAAKEMGIPTLPPTLTEDIASDPSFLDALNHILFHVHLVQGLLTCPVTAKEFPVQNGIPNMILDEEECEAVRF